MEETSSRPDLDASAVPEPDMNAEPTGLVVVVDPGDRIHFLDWGEPRMPDGGPGVLLIHGLSTTAWTWAAVARRLCRVRRTVAMDVRGHGLSDAPTSGFDPETLGGDVIAVAEGARLLPWPAAAVDLGNRLHPGAVVVGHGFGAIVATWAAERLAARCAGLVLVDGGFEDMRTMTGLEPDEFLRGLDEPPEVMRSMASFLDDREAFDSASWDADQERAARATVVETVAGRLVPTTRPHVLAACVAAMFDYHPAESLPRVTAPIVALVAAENEEGTRAGQLTATQRALTAVGRHVDVQRFPADGHNLPRYRPREVSAAILSVAGDEKTLGNGTVDNRTADNVNTSVAGRATSG
jgi:pimeloyl-ACP methyl ester carboxylesterase